MNKGFFLLLTFFSGLFSAQQNAYYPSDNPLETGSTLSSGGLGLTGVKPTYMITYSILKKILESGMKS